MKRLLIISMFLGAFACNLQAQANLVQLKQLFLAQDYADLFNPLLDYVSSLQGNSNFESDYMMGVTLCNSGYEDDGRAYLYQTQVKFSSPASQIFNGQNVSLSNAITACSPVATVSTGGTQSHEPGAQSVMLKKLDLRTQQQILSSVKTAKAKKPSAFNSAVAASAVPHAVPTAPSYDGIYNIVHDGWKGELILRGTAGEYIDSNGRKFRVQAQFVPDHKVVFYVIGLGGENANGTGGQKFEGYFFTQTKDGMAGTTWWQNQPFGFYAVKR
jgi:hypothetical protein